MNGKHDSATVLKTAYDALEQEFNRIDKLLRPSNKNLIGGKIETIRRQFTGFLSEGQNKIIRIKQAIESNSPEKAWQDYIEMKTKTMPTLSSELLAVIGGVYLMEANLEELDTNPQESDADKKIHLSASKTAEDLVKYLTNYSGRNWQSVLIVGEERFKFSEAEIIRLRFPACNIWHLPFIAHEYGYLVAKKDHKPDEFRDLRDKVRSDVNPKNHRSIGVLPKNQECFLADVVSIWKNYHDLEKLRSEDERQEFLRTKEQQLIILADEQESFLCRLFADAFATFFIGPAYIHALLNLRFSPGDSPLPGMPPFDHRFVFALETLKSMDNEPIIDQEKNRHVFKRELLEQGGIPYLWRETLKSLGMKDQYSEILTKYTPWLDHIKQALQSHFSYGVKYTFENWISAQEIEKKITEPNLKVDSYPEIVAILNAAWTARWENPESVTAIQINAVRLLAKDPFLLESQPKPGSGPPRVSAAPAPASGSVTDECITIVKLALFDKGIDIPSKLFTQMAQSKRFIYSTDIVNALEGDDKALKAFQQLCNPKSPIESSGRAA